MKKNKEKLLESLSPQMTRRSKMISKCCQASAITTLYLRALLEQTKSHRQTDGAFVSKTPSHHYIEYLVIISVSNLFYC